MVSIHKNFLEEQHGGLHYFSDMIALWQPVIMTFTTPIQVLLRGILQHHDKMF